MSESGYENPIHKRDGWRCVMHGDRAATVHHRNHRHRDGRPSVRISTCGSGTTGAHGWIEAHPRLAGLGLEHGPGWTISRHALFPSLIPVWYEHGPLGQGWYLLDDDYGFAGWPGSVLTQELRLER